MTKTSISLQDLQRKMYAKAKAEATHRFWGLCGHVSNAETLLADEKLLAFYLAATERHGGGLPAVIAAGREPGAVARTKDYLLAHLAEATDFQELARHVGLSAWHLIRVFRKATGLTPHAWLVDRRVHQARELLRAGESPSLIAAQCGFADQAHLTRAFKARLGVTPGQYKAFLN